MSVHIIKPFFSYSRNALILFAACFALVMNTSCGKQKPPEPPKAKPQLLLEIYDSLRAGDHSAALNKIQRMKAIEKTSIFLAELELLERSNLIMSEAKKLVSEGKHDEALKLLNESSATLSSAEDLKTAISDINRISQVEKLLSAVKSPKNSDELAQNCRKLIVVAGGIPQAGKFSAYAAERLAEVEFIAAFEQDRALFNLCAETEKFYGNSWSEGAVAASILAVESPDHPQTDYMKKRMFYREKNKRK